MLPAFRLGLGGPLGSGDQFVPWIHLDDVLDIVLRAVTDERYQGALNVSGPEPLTSREFGATLGAAVRMPAKLGAPRFALQLLLGERAQVTLQSQRTLPAALEGLGYRFRHASLAEALRAILGVADRVRVRRASPSERKDLPTRPAYVLEHRSELRTPLAETFAFFCKAENLGLITPDWMRFEMLGAPAQSIQAGTELDYKIGLGPLPMRWKTVISRWSPPSGFVDNQARGPYSLWWHEHSLEAHGGGTSMLDRVYYTPPFGLLGRLVHALFIRRMLRAIFAYRAEATERLFGTPRLS
jgi:ligand-binding SRPBCC domain-containing protein